MYVCMYVCIQVFIFTYIGREGGREREREREYVCMYVCIVYSGALHPQGTVRFPKQATGTPPAVGDLRAKADLRVQAVSRILSKAFPTWEFHKSQGPRFGSPYKAQSQDHRVLWSSLRPLIIRLLCGSFQKPEAQRRIRVKPII